MLNYTFSCISLTALCLSGYIIFPKWIHFVKFIFHYDTLQCQEKLYDTGKQGPFKKIEGRHGYSMSCQKFTQGFFFNFLEKYTGIWFHTFTGIVKNIQITYNQSDKLKLVSFCAWDSLLYYCL